MANLNEVQGFVSKQSKSVHDISQSYAHTTALGFLRPMYAHALMPGDRLKFGGTYTCRLNPLVSPAMAKLHMNVDHFFVPASMLYTAAPNILTQTPDLISSFYKDTAFSDKFPLVDLQKYFGSTSRLQFPSVASNHKYCDFGDYQDENFTNIDFDSSSEQETRYLNSFDCDGKSIYRLLEDCHLNPDVIFQTSGDHGEIPDYNPYTFLPAFFPWKLMAYQAAFQNYFRLDNRQRFDVTAYNIDQFSNHDVVPVVATNEAADKFYHKLLTLHYARAYQDYFTSVKVSPLGSPVNQLSSASISEYLSKVQDYLGIDSSRGIASQEVYGTSGSYDGGFNVDNNFPQTVMSSVYYNDQFHDVGVSTIRDIFAVERLLRIFARNEKTYDAQILGQFGFKVPHDVKHELTHIGHDKGTINIGQVVSTAAGSTGNGSTSVLGELAGTGFGFVQMKQRKYTAPCHGFFISIVSIVPEFAYFGTLDKLNFLNDRMSWPIPAFDKLGMQPLFTYETGAQPHFWYGSDEAQRVNQGSVGWQYRWEQFKRKHDRVSRAFMIPDDASKAQGVVNPLSTWVLARRPYNDFVFGRNDVNTPTLPLGAFYVSPKDMDNISLLSYDTGWSDEYVTKPWLIYQYDQLICKFEMNAYLTSWMSPTGEPDLR